MQTMYILSINVKTVATPFNLHYNEERAIKTAYDAIAEKVVAGAGGIELTDDYGATLSMPVYDIGAVHIVNLQRGLAAQSKIGLMQAEEQARAQARAASSPALSLAGQPRGLFVPGQQ